MMQEFAKHIESDLTKTTFDHKKRRLRCLAHIINLATQALLSTHSKSKHVDVTKPDDELVASRHDQRDEVGLIRSISVKERSSASRKELFRKLQLRDEDGHIPASNPRQLLLDMKVRWSSTFVMLRRAYELRDVCATSQFSTAPFSPFCLGCELFCWTARFTRKRCYTTEKTC